MKGWNSRPEPGQLAGADNLQDLVDRLSELIGNSITVESASFELIVYSRHAGDADTARRLTILQKRVPQPIIKALTESGMLEILNASPRPVRLSSLATVGLSDRVAMPIRVGNGIRAYFWVQETERRLTDDDFATLEQAASLAAVHLVRMDQQKETRHRLITDLLWELLANPAVDVDAIRHRASRLGIELPAAYRVAVADVDDFRTLVRTEKLDEYAIDRIKREIAAALQDKALRSGLLCLSTRYSDNIVLIVGLASGRGEGANVPPFSEAARRAAADKGIQLSVAESGVRHHIAEAGDAYREAERCLEVGRAFGWSNFGISSDRLGVLQFLPDLAGSSGSGTAVHAKLASLFDAESSGGLAFALAETLETYLDCGCNAQRAAERLFVHPNTLYYRLRRIVERTGLDLSDGIERLAVHLELKLRRVHLSSPLKR